MGAMLWKHLICQHTDSAVFTSHTVTLHPSHAYFVWLPCRIGIIAAGALRCLGTSLHLKSRFGAGLRLCVGLTSAQVSRACIIYPDAQDAQEYHLRVSCQDSGVSSCPTRAGLLVCGIWCVLLAVLVTVAGRCIYVLSIWPCRHVYACMCKYGGRFADEWLPDNLDCLALQCLC
jgi:hypothetical protein